MNSRFRGIKLVILVLLCNCSSISKFQDVPQYDIFPSLYGNELLDSLRVNYKPRSVLSYNEARDLMFSRISNIEGLLICIYTGDQIYIDPDSDTPRTDAHINGWNTEHIWPQSKGAASGRARSDLHHLFPVRANVNSSRGNLPFAYLEDFEVTRWWKGKVNQIDIPEGELSGWSKTKSNPDPQGFEVRDESKGDVARAMFYFYTAYPDKADPDFFHLQLEVLQKNHNQDRVDIGEYQRTISISEVQAGMVNPFVVDTTLVRRAFFENYENP